MTWDEMMRDLRRAGVPEINLPVRGNSEGRLGLRRETEKIIVSTTERGEPEDLGEFSTEEGAVEFMFDIMVFHMGLNGDTRVQRWNNSGDFSLWPRAEQFGGRTLRS
jgi:hypothetical protein